MMISKKIENLFFNKIDQDTVYHYTTIDSFVAILESKSLWLTYIGGLNDYTELEHGVDCFHEIFKEATKTAPPEVIDIFDKLCDNMKTTKESNICVGSFCKSGDLLGQWRAYANDGSGIAIGFNSQELSKICEINKFHFSECFYEDAVKKKICQEVLNIFLEGFDKKKDKADYHNAMKEIVMVMLVFSLFLKDGSFKEEMEVRLATPPGMDLDTKKIGNRWLSFYPLKLESGLERIIQEIYVGPGNKQAELSKAIEVLLKNHKINNCSIKLSKIPYRSLRNY